MKKIMIDALTTVTCPHCNSGFVLEDALTHQLIERYEQEYGAELDRERHRLRELLATEAERSAAGRYEAELARLQSQLAQSEQIKIRQAAQAEADRKQAAADAREESERKARALAETLKDKDRKLDAYRESELALRREKEALVEQQKELALEVQRRVDAERQRMEEASAETFRLREAEWRKKIEDAQRANDELKRKLEQGSQQLRGEVLELEIEDLLVGAFPYDSIEPVRKGARGADVIHTVRLRSGAACGRIVWEMKRAEHWSNAWVGKLKDDQQAAGGELAVLVSTAFPSGIEEPMCLHEGVWLVRPDLVRALADALRTVLIESQRQKQIGQGRDAAKEAVYDYLTSAQFAQKIRAVIEAYQQMRDDLDKEKAAMQRLWKKREGQLERVASNMFNLCGELQGVSRDALPQLDDIGALPS